MRLPTHLRSTLEEISSSPQFSGQLGVEFKPYAAELLNWATGFSRAPISGFHVGAIAVGHSGKLYPGANYEFAGTPLNTALHAEQSAIVNAWMHEEKAITSLYVSEIPCGHCRQFLRELSNIYSVEIHCKGKVFHLNELLPNAFGDERAQGKGLLDSQPIEVQAIQPIENTNALRTVNAARRSYAPYSRCPEGFAIECLDGHCFSGRAAESVAFNPSVPAITAALNQRNLSGSRNVAISNASLAKVVTAPNNPLPLAEAILQTESNTVIDIVRMEITL